MVSAIVLYLLFRFYLINYILFHPDKKVIGPHALKVDDVQINHLHGWWAEPQKATSKTIILFHGNAGNISHREHLIDFLLQIPANILIFDYSGYGKSGGSPGVKTLCDDGRLVAEWVEKTRPHDDIYLYGVSLGGAVACHVASEFRAKGLVLQSTFSGTDDYVWSILKPLFPWFKSRDCIELAGCPVLVLHSDEDEIVPCEYGKKLYRHAKDPKEFFTIYGGHNTTHFTPEFLGKLHEFVYQQGD